MTNRYDLLIQAIATTNTTIEYMFLFALGMVLAYPVLGWLPHWLVRPMQYFYLASLLALSVFVTVLTVL